MDPTELIQYGIAAGLMYLVNKKVDLIVVSINGFGKSLQEVADHLTKRQDLLEARMEDIEDAYNAAAESPQIGFVTSEED